MYNFFFGLDDGTREKTIIKDLQSKGYRFVLPRDYFNGDNKGKVALLIHDMDFKLGGLETFIKIETELGVKSAFYPRYNLALGKDVYYHLMIANREGFEVGFQYECLSAFNGNFTLAYQLFNTQLSWFKLMFNVQTTDYHGDVNHLNILNLDLYNETLWHSLGLNEVYSLTNYSYYTDTNNNLVTPKSLEDLVIIQLHADWTR
jgi:hypothetical protein